MISKDKIEELVLGIIESSESQRVEDGKGEELPELATVLEHLEEPHYVNGRRGEFYRVTFTYTVSLLEDEPEDASLPILKNTYRRSARITPDGKVSGLSEKELVDSQSAALHE